jgi:FkbM family methyltransferase
MRLRAEFKHFLHNHVPGFRGWFPYFGSRLFFPPGSESFRIICHQGIFEHDNLRIAAAAARPASVIYDVGANIGQMAAPLLFLRSDVSIVSFEPSPSSVNWLRMSVEHSPFKERWTLVEKAVGRAEGDIDFHIAPTGMSLYEGTVHTNRKAKSRTVSVPLTTLDAVWTASGRPDVSFIKIDTEGGEGDVLDGAAEVITQCRPSILIEWNAENLRARGISPSALLTIADRYGLRVLTAPSLAVIEDDALIPVAMNFTETFLLVPRTARSPARPGPN